MCVCVLGEWAGGGGGGGGANVNGSSIRENCFHQSLLFSSFTITTALIFLNYFSTVLYIVFSFLFSSSKKKTFIPIKGNHATAYHIYYIMRCGSSLCLAPSVHSQLHKVMVFLVPSLTEPYPKTFGWPGPWARHHHPTSVPNINNSVSVLQIKGLWYRWTAFEPGFMLASFLLVSLVIVQQMNTINTYQRPKIGYMPTFFFIKCILNNLLLCDSAFKTLRDSQNVAFFFLLLACS